MQATTDPKPAAQANQLVYNADGYYTYTFSTNITDPTKTNGVVFEPGITHRVAIQLSYTNAAGQTVLVNPYFDVTFDANGRSVAVTDPSKTRVMADVTSCNGCHDKLALHGGGRVDMQYCVMCHNPGTTDANSGNVLTMQTMTHKIHAGRLLYRPARDGRLPLRDLGLPEPASTITRRSASRRTCATAASATPQPTRRRRRATTGSTSTSKEVVPDLPRQYAGLEVRHDAHRLRARAGRAEREAEGHPEQRAAPTATASAPQSRPSACTGTRTRTTRPSTRSTSKARRSMPPARKVTVKYSLTDPTSNNALWNLVTSDCTGSGPSLTCSSTTQFGNLRFYLAYQNMVGQPTSVTEFTAYNNGGSGANAYLYKGMNDGSNRYTVDIPLPADAATAVAQRYGASRRRRPDRGSQHCRRSRRIDPRPRGHADAC